MKKLVKVISLITGLVCLLTACGGNQNNNGSSKITLSTDNFKEYFTIDVDSDIDITKHGGNTILGVYVTPTYTAVADVDVNVFAKVPLDSYDVKVTLEITTGYVYWNSQTVVLNLSSSGSAKKSITISTSSAKEILFEADCKKDFYARVKSVEGSIINK